MCRYPLHLTVTLILVFFFVVNINAISVPHQNIGDFNQIFMPKQSDSVIVAAYSRHRGERQEVLPWQVNLVSKYLGLQYSMDDDFMTPKIRFRKRKKLDPSIPWQLQLLKRYFQAQEDPVINLVEPIPEKVTLIKGIVSFLRKYITISRRQLIIYGKISALITIFVFLARSVSSWYKSVADYELLLDHHDYLYHEYGCKIEGNVASSLIKCAPSNTATDYSNLYILQFIQSSLEAPLFPRKYLEYSNMIGNDISRIILEINKIQRSKKKKRGVIEASYSEVEQEYLQFYHFCLIVLESKALESSIRHLINQLLLIVNNVEDLSETWRSRLRQQSQIRRLPYSRDKLYKAVQRTNFYILQTAKSCNQFVKFWANRLLSKLFPQSRLSGLDSTSSAAMVAAELSIQDKLQVLAMYKDRLYSGIGNLYGHLSELNQIHRSVENSSRWISPSVIFKNEGLVSRIEEWTSRGSAISREALRKLSEVPAAVNPLKSRSTIVASSNFSRNDSRAKHSDGAAYREFAVSTNQYLQQNNYICNAKLFRELIESTFLDSQTLFNETIIGSRISVAEFDLPTSLHDAVAVCLIHNDTFIRTLTSIGDEILDGGHWNCFHLSALDNDGVILENEGEIRKKYFINSSQCDNIIWSKQLTYKHLTKGRFFGHNSADFSLIQILNVSSIDSEIISADFKPMADGCAILATYVNASQSAFSNNGYNYTVISTFLSNPMIIDDSVHQGIQLNRTTKVIIDVEVQVEPGQSRSDLLKAQLDVIKYMKDFLFVWKASALAAINENSILCKKRNMTENECILLQSLGFDDDELDRRQSKTAPSSQEEFIATESSGTMRYMFRNRGSTNGDGYKEAIVAIPSINQQLNENIGSLKSQLRSIMEINRDASRASQSISDYLESTDVIGKKNYLSIFKYFRLRRLLRVIVWISVWKVAIEASQKWDKVIDTARGIKMNALGFFERRISTPTKSIFQDVLLNKKMSLTDKDALIDSKRSLSTMLYDFLSQYEGRRMSEDERLAIAAQMDMEPISMEYELELRRPMQNILTGKLARLVLIQLQFVKKELLTAMQALDQLFNANQVNLQFMAVTPAIMIMILAQSLTKKMIGAIISTSRGRAIDSSSAAFQSIRARVRDMERKSTIASRSTKLSAEFNVSSTLPPFSQLTFHGQVMSDLHRIHKILLINSIHFETSQLHQLQEDLRDLADMHLSTNERLIILERMSRSYSFLGARQKSWSSGLIS